MSTKNRSIKREKAPPKGWKRKMPHLTRKQSGIAAAAMSLLAMLAALPYTLGSIATIIPSDLKPSVTIISMLAAFVLRVINQTSEPT